MQEYFAFPARFRFISLSGLGTLIERCEGEKAFDIFILLDKSDEQLERVVDASHLALHCTPVNLFPKVAARQKLNEGQHEYHLRSITFVLWIMKFTRSKNLWQRGRPAR